MEDEDASEGPQQVPDASEGPQQVPDDVRSADLEREACQTSPLAHVNVDTADAHAGAGGVSHVGGGGGGGGGGMLCLVVDGVVLYCHPVSAGVMSPSPFTSSSFDTAIGRAAPDWQGAAGNHFGRGDFSRFVGHLDELRLWLLARPLRLVQLHRFVKACLRACVCVFCVCECVWVCMCLLLSVCMCVVVVVVGAASK